MEFVLVDEVRSVGEALHFAAWSLVVLGMAKALFRSMPWMELMAHLHLRDSARTNRMHEINWSLRNGERFSPARAKNDDMAARQPLTPDDVRSLRAELRTLARGSFWHRAATFFSECLFCQSLWPAVALGLAMRGPSAGVALSALAYAVVAGGLGRVLLPSSSAPPAARRSGGCSTCGG